MTIEWHSLHISQRGAVYVLFNKIKSILSFFEMPTILSSLLVCFFLLQENYFDGKIMSMAFEDSKYSRALNQPVTVPDFSIFDRVTYAKVRNVYI